MRKLFIFSIAAAALIFAFISLDTASNNNAFEIVVNNTNLAPDAGAPYPHGTGERLSGVTYYANTTPIEILLFAHANAVGQNANINLSIDGVEVMKTALRPLGAAEQTFTTLQAVIPRRSNYTAVFNNAHHYEWREYPILSGKNGTLSINQTIFNNFTNITNGSQINNGSIQINESQVNNLTSDLNSKVNKSGDTMNLTGNTRINMSNNGIITGSYDTWFHPSFASFTFFTSNRFQDKISGWQCLDNCNNSGGTVIWNNDRFQYWSFPTNSTVPVLQITLAANGIIHERLAGVGDAFVCVHSDGLEYRC